MVFLLRLLFISWKIFQAVIICSVGKLTFSLCVRYFAYKIDGRRSIRRKFSLLKIFCSEMFAQYFRLKWTGIGKDFQFNLNSLREILNNTFIVLLLLKTILITQLANHCLHSHFYFHYLTLDTWAISKKKLTYVQRWFKEHNVTLIFDTV